MLKRGGKVYALPVADASGPTLLTALQTRVQADSVVYSN
jgi:transposase